MHSLSLAQVDVVMRYHESHLADFTGYLLVDTNSNQYLNLTLHQFRGTLHGLVIGSNSTQAIQISRTSPGVTQSSNRAEEHSYDGSSSNGRQMRDLPEEEQHEQQEQQVNTVWKEVRVTGILCNKKGQVYDCLLYTSPSPRD